MTSRLHALPDRINVSWFSPALLLALVGMEMSWFAPLILSLHRRGWGTAPGWYLAGLIAVMLAMMAVARVLSARRIGSPAFELLVLATIVFIGLVILRLYVFRGEPWSSLAWLGPAFITADPRRVDTLLVLVTVAYLWWRGVSFLQRDVTFFSIGLDFRKGVLGLAIGASLYDTLTHHPAGVFIYAFFFFSLVAVALGRIEDKAATSNSPGARPGFGWMGIIAAGSLAVVALITWLSRLWSAEVLSRLGQLLAPAAAGLGRLLAHILVMVLRLLEPLMVALVALLRFAISPLLARLRQQPPAFLETLDTYLSQPAGAQVAAPAWIEPLFRVVLPCTLGVLVLLALALWLQRRRATSFRSQEAETRSPATGREQARVGDGLARLVDRVRGLTALIGRFGIGRRFYAALSVRHIYANVQHLAADQGFPRHKAQTPNDYLPALAAAFPGHEADVTHITTVYNACEYGDVPTDAAELRRLHDVWEAIRGDAERTTSGSSQTT